MATKLAFIVLLMLEVVLTRCKPAPEETLIATDPLPANTWSVSCAQLAPDSVGFRLTGICCAYVVFPEIKLNQRRQFSVNADYYSFNGAGFSRIPITASGELASDDNKLTLNYSMGSAVTTYHLRPGKATLICDCACL